MTNAINVGPAVPNFKAAYCDHFGCTEETFQDHLFWKALDPGWRPVARVIRRLRLDYFRNDLEFLRRLGEASTRRDFTGQANSIRQDQSLNFGFLRKQLHFRISGSRLIKLRDEIMQERMKSVA